MKKLIFILIVFGFLVSIKFVQAEDLAQGLSGRILLQTESRGEAWYVCPDDQRRYFLGRPADAFNLMREKGFGISNADLEKIPVDLSYQNGLDLDSDGLGDDFEKALGTNPVNKDTDGDGFNDKEELLNGYNPLGAHNLKVDLKFAQKHKGKIFLQVEKRGEAWYVNPANLKRYFLGRPADAFNLMRSLGLGIANIDLEKIIANSSSFTGTQLEEKIFSEVNKQRSKNALDALKWNNDLAAVAREHSENLARENRSFTGTGMSCTYPVIHHEGLDFGIYNAERLQNRGFYYYASAAENIALVPLVLTQVLFKEGDPEEASFYACPEKRASLDKKFKSELDAEKDENEKIKRIETEIAIRTEEFAQENPLSVIKQDWFSETEVVMDIVDGWMNSPGHRANILEAEFDEAGIGNATFNDYIISTQVFIKRASCGYKDGACCQEKDYYPYCFIPLKCINLTCE